MTDLFSLWLPILLSAVAVFILSSLIHMVTPWHKGDYRKAPQEDGLMDAVRSLGIPPGDYMVPCPGSREEMASAGFCEKVKKGPVMVLTVMPGKSMSMTRELVLWFLYLVIVGVFAAYIAGHALPPVAGFRPVLRFAGATAFIGYAVALWQMSIWYHRSWGTTLRITVDGLAYALVTGCIFGWLWPR